MEIISWLDGSSIYGYHVVLKKFIPYGIVEVWRQFIFILLNRLLFLYFVITVSESACLFYVHWNKRFFLFRCQSTFLTNAIWTVVPANGNSICLEHSSNCGYCIHKIYCNILWQTKNQTFINLIKLQIIKNAFLYKNELMLQSYTKQTWLKKYSRYFYN